MLRLWQGWLAICGGFGGQLFGTQDAPQSPDRQDFPAAQSQNLVVEFVAGVSWICPVALISPAARGIASEVSMYLAR